MGRKIPRLRVGLGRILTADVTLPFFWHRMKGPNAELLALLKTTEENYSKDFSIQLDMVSRTLGEIVCSIVTYSLGRPVLHS